MNVSPLRGHRAPTAGAAGASVPLEWRLHLIAGYLPPLIAVASWALARRTPVRTA